MPLKDLNARRLFQKAYYQKTKDALLAKRKAFYSIIAISP